MEPKLVKVAASTSVKAFVPFTAVPNDWSGKMVEIRLLTAEELAAMQESESDELPWEHVPETETEIDSLF